DVLYKSDDAILLIGESTFVDCNEATARMLGYATRQEFLQTHPSALSPEVQPCGRSSFEKAEEMMLLAAEKGFHRFEWVHRRASGEDFPVEVSLTPIVHGGKSVLHCVWRDISDIKRAAQALQESERRFMDVLYKSDDAILLIGENTFVDCNEATARMLGYPTRSEFLQTHPSELSPPVQPCGRTSFEKADEMMRLAFEKGFHRFEWVHRRASGDDFPVEVSLTPIVHEGKSLLHCGWRDLTELKRAEAELRQAQKLQAVGQLAAGVAHEINTPAQFVGDSLHFLSDSFRDMQRLLGEYRKALAALLADAERSHVQSELAVAEEAADHEYVAENAPRAFERALDGVARISTLVQAMKEFAHPGTKEKTPTDLNRALATTLTIAKNEYKLVADVETDFGDLPPVACISGELNQVFLNLIVNAAHAIADVVSASGGRGVIRVRTRRDGGQVRIEISDTGAGIPEAVRARVFEPFFTTKEVGRGSGQGLAIARSVVVEKHGGGLSFETTSGQGTTFAVVLPVS
ncbi:MAG: PAS domain-containing protein, partial [Polyangiaceae bacterium]|nr:PAS domain-containing protein [Polyangiaceae bacterium]